jgi:hypothetical protein
VVVVDGTRGGMVVGEGNGHDAGESNVFHY